MVIQGQVILVWIRYLLIFNNPGKDTNNIRRFFVVGVYYDEDNKPINHVATEIIPFSNKIKNIVKQTIYKNERGQF